MSHSKVKSLYSLEDKGKSFIADFKKQNADSTIGSVKDGLFSKDLKRLHLEESICITIIGKKEDLHRI